MRGDGIVVISKDEVEARRAILALRSHKSACPLAEPGRRIHPIDPIEEIADRVRAAWLNKRSYPES